VRCVRKPRAAALECICLGRALCRVDTRGPWRQTIRTTGRTHDNEHERSSPCAFFLLYTYARTIHRLFDSHADLPPGAVCRVDTLSLLLHHRRLRGLGFNTRPIGGWTRQGMRLCPRAHTSSGAREHGASPAGLICGPGRCVESTHSRCLPAVGASGECDLGHATSVAHAVRKEANRSKALGAASRVKRRPPRRCPWPWPQRLKSAQLACASYGACRCVDSTHRRRIPILRRFS
jgi:hypothetical protein